MKTAPILLAAAMLLTAACHDSPAESPSTSITSTTSASGTSATPTTGTSTHGVVATPDPATNPAPPYTETVTGLPGDGLTSREPDAKSESAAANRASGARSSTASDAPAAATTTEPVATATEGRAVTAGDQGNGKDEVRITAEIRRQLVASKLSFTAKNAKVVTQGSKVTLRGNVKSDAERAQVETIARGIAGVTEIDDQLRVKP